MADLLVLILIGIGFGVGKWILPLVSGRQLVLRPRGVPPASQIRPWQRLPSGQIGIDALFFGITFAAVVLFATIELLCLILP
jgi:hypothetical protein